MQKDFLELCKEIILIDSSPEGGTAEIASFAKKLCLQAGLDVELQTGELLGKKQYNIIARPKNSLRKNEVIFQTHLDTVEPGPKPYWTETQNNPFKATIKEGKIFGLGAADVKLDFLCKLEALKEFSQTKMKNPFVLIGTFGEELDMEGAKLLMQSQKVNATKAIIGEPSELKIVYANNGYGVCHFDVAFSNQEIALRKSHKNDSRTTNEKIFHGKAAHSSTPHLGDNAILKLMDYLEKLPSGIGILEVSGGTVPNTVAAQAQIAIDTDFILPKPQQSIGDKLLLLTRELKKLEREFLNHENNMFSPPHPTLNIGVLKTQEKGIRLTVSFRFTPQITNEQIKNWWERLEKFSNSLGVLFSTENMTSPALTPLDSDLVKGAIEIAKKLKLPESPITKASATECSVYVNYGIQCIVFGPGKSIGNSHTANEHNEMAQLELAKEFYKEAVKRFCI
ncbi:MAG: M20/M25/M40 family metallo-hydrolase [Oligoflexia bacterium]|nr:M20/M25/M40 family metallo-hydrolase [Oligoflexia bacterium]